MTTSTHFPTAPAKGPRLLLARLADAATWLTPHSLLALVNRVAIAGIFWLSARTKVEGWFTLSDSAYALFRDEYKLPLLPPELAAQMATGAEHLFPALLPFVYVLGRAFLGTVACVFSAGVLSQWAGHLLPGVGSELSLVARWLMAWGD
eukprot:gene61519-biopygen44676